MPLRQSATILAAPVCLFAAACSPAGAPALKDLPPEQSLTCAVHIFAVTAGMDIKPGNVDAEAVKSGGMAAFTHYGTLYARAQGLSSDELLGVVKLKAYRMTRKLPGGPVTPPLTIIERAKACITPEEAS